MDRLPKDKFLEYNSDTLAAVRRLYNLDKPGQVDQAIDLLDAWIKKQSHFVVTDFPREYLERVIMLLKGSVERAKIQLDKLCTMRTLMPVYFEKHDVKKDLTEVDGIWYITLLPKLTPNHTRIFAMKFIPDFLYTSHQHVLMFTYMVIMLEYIKAHDYSDGVCTIMDYRQVNPLSFASAINLTELRQMSAIFLQGYATRIKNIFIISESKAIDVLVKIFKQLLSDKLKERIVVLKNADDLLEYFPKEVLPSDFGGTLKSIPKIHDEFKEVLGSPENVQYIKEISKARTNESKRSTIQFNEEYLGMPGTFRTLNVD